MAKKQTKRQFDWKTYSRPARLLSPAQEAASSSGVLAPVLDWCRSDPRIAFEIRARAASLYAQGAPLLRIAGEEPFVAEWETSEGGPPERRELGSASDVAALAGDLEERTRVLLASEPQGPRSRRDYLQAIARANGGPAGDLAGNEYLVVDLEYAAGKRRFDLVALKRTAGVTGPGGFANPRLVFVDVRSAEQTLTGPNGLDAVGADLAEFAKALGGSHLERTRFEIAELAAQKVRLGLLPADLEVRAIDGGLPEFLVVFAEYPSLAEKRHDPVLSGLHDRLVARHFPPERLRFAVLPSVPSVPDESAATGRIDPDGVYDYRGFKALRARTRD